MGTLRVGDKVDAVVNTDLRQATMAQSHGLRIYGRPGCVKCSATCETGGVARRTESFAI